MFFIVMTLCFTTVYGDINSNKYADFTDTFITVFDDLMGSYGYDGFKEHEIPHMWLLIFTVYGGNIIFLNYLVAILSDSYSNLLESGVFFFKVTKY